MAATACEAIAQQIHRATAASCLLAAIASSRRLIGRRSRARQSLEVRAEINVACPHHFNAARLAVIERAIHQVSAVRGRNDDRVPAVIGKIASELL
jgi:hypothetical protein